MRIRWTIRLRMLVGFLVVAVLVMAVAVIGNFYISRVSEASAVYEEAVPRQAAVLEIEVSCLELYAVVIGHVSDPTPNRSWGDNEEVRNADEEITKYLTALKDGSPELGIARPTDPEYIAAIDSLAGQYATFKNLGQKLYEQHTKELANNVPQAKWAASKGVVNEQLAPAMTIGIGGALDRIRGFIAEDLEASYSELEDAKNSSSQTTLLALILGPALAIVVGLYISWSIMKPLKKATDAMQNIASGEADDFEMLHSSDELSDAMNEMNATLAAKMRDLRAEQSRTLAAITDLRRVARSVAESANEVAATAEQVSVTTSSINEGVETQAVATDQTSAAIEEMAAAIEQVAGNAEILGSATDETAATIGQMTASIEAIARTVDGLSGAVTDTSASVEEMIASIEQVAERAREVSGVSEKAASASENGATAVETMSRSMEAVVGAIENTAEVMKVLGRRSQEIGEIAEVIDDIAEQTNLLALNAAIEAARAGEHGRGFAVVASAVRDLAERSTSSTKEISKLIDSIRSDTEDALAAVVRGVEEANQSRQVSVQAKSALAHITESFGEVRDSMRLIQGATAQQASGGKQVLGAVDEMKRLQESVDVAIQEQANGSRQIVETMDRMNTLVVGVVGATAEQKRGGEQMVLAVQNIADTTRQNVTAIQQLASAASNLAHQSEAMRELVRGLQDEEKQGDEPAEVAPDEESAPAE